MPSVLPFPCRPQCRAEAPAQQDFPCCGGTGKALSMQTSPGIAAVVFFAGVKLQGLLHHRQGLSQTLGTPRGAAEAMPGREHGRHTWGTGNVPQIFTIPGLTVGRATSLVILCCKYKGNGFSVPFWSAEQWRASFGNTVMGSMFQRLEFLLSCCETLGSQEHESV